MNALQAWIESLEGDRALDDPLRLRERAQALDRLETHFPPASEGEPEVHGLTRRAMALRMRWEAINHRLYDELREELRDGRGGERLLTWSAEHGDVDVEGYDHLDDLLAGVLPFEPPGDVAGQPAEMVFYQPTPARHLFELIRRISLSADDVVMDLGSGLGHAPLLVALCTQARAIGIEREAAYVLRARECASALNAHRAEFILQDARDADFSIGTVFYLYTPFTGSVLRSVLDALRHEADHRAIRVCTYGPCANIVAHEPWLCTIETVRADRLTLFCSRRAGPANP